MRGESNRRIPGDESPGTNPRARYAVIPDSPRTFHCPFKPAQSGIPAREPRAGMNYRARPPAFPAD